MKKYYAMINDVYYYMGSYRTINEARKRAEIEADRMKQKVSSIVITGAELREVEDEHGKQVVLDINEINKAVSTIMSVCDKIGYEFNGCDECPFVNKDGECSVNYPCEWGCSLSEVVCNVGDYIYKIPNVSVYGSHILNNRPQDNKVYEIEITSIERDEQGYLLKHKNYYPGYRLENYGREWFLTREEAEQALIEIGQKYEAWKAGVKNE